MSKFFKNFLENMEKQGVELDDKAEMSPIVKSLIDGYGNNSRQQHIKVVHRQHQNHHQQAHTLKDEELDKRLLDELSNNREAARSNSFGK